jgi:hypothetical protein
LIREKIYDIYSYLGFDIRAKREEVFTVMKQLRNKNRKITHNNQYIAVKKNIKKELYMHIKKLIRRVDEEGN